MALNLYFCRRARNALGRQTQNMKIRFTLLAAFLMIMATSFAQQVPNGSFENWTNEYSCTSWTGVELLLQNLIPWQASFFTFKDTTTFTDGSASIKIMADTIPGAPTFGVIPGVASLGIGFLNGTSPSFVGIPFIYRPDSVIFDYKFTTPGVDSGAASLSLTYNGIPLVEAPGRPALQTKLAPDSNWVHFAIAMAPYYLNNLYPDSLLIQFVASTQTPTVFGSNLHIDNVRFGYVNQPLSVTSTGRTIFCSPTGSANLQAHTGGSTAYTNQWNLVGTAISGATNSSYTATDTGSYTVTIDSASVATSSEPIIISVDNIVATLTGLNDTLCNNANAITLAGGTPDGGLYSGSGVSSSTFFPSTANPGLDTITYAVTDQNGCAKSAVATVFVETCTGINPVATTNLLIYPNPTSTVLNITSNASLAGFNLQVFDLLGREVISQVLEGSANTINVSKLIAGVYISRITDAVNNVVLQDKFAVIR